MRALAREAMRPDGGFLASFLPFVEHVAWLGAQNSLVANGAEADGSRGSRPLPGLRALGPELLVDPDNRRAVDYRKREAELARLAPRLASERDRSELIESLLRAWGDGRIKLAVTALLLAFRREHAKLFAEGGYQPVEVIGEDARWALGYVRSDRERRLAVLVARFPALREAKPDWRAQAQMPEGEWFDPCAGGLSTPMLR